jgi:thiamine transport system ATP-binding protein
MLRATDLRLEYPDFVGQYSLAVAAGSLCAIIGPSGGGKTTFIHAIAGFETPVSGTLSWHETDLLPLPPARRPIAMVFQDHNLFPHLSARDNVGLGLRPSLRLADHELAAIETALAEVGLAGFGGRRPDELSGGQRQRVALARALISGRPLLLLDEPFGALDQDLREDMTALVDRLRHDRGLTVIMTIHTPEDIVGVADQMALIQEGLVVAAGRPREIMARSQRPVSPGT